MNCPDWITIENVPGAEYVVSDITYLDETQSGGRVNIYVMVVDANGPLSGVGVVQAWPDGSVVQYTMAGVTDFPMSGDSSFAPDRGESGPYSITCLGKSERVHGLGLPLRRHVVYQITFRKQGGEPPPSGGGLTEADVRRICREEMRSVIAGLEAIV